MVNPLMPKATAMWLIENTSLTFSQIANFCGLHILEVKGMADGDVVRGIAGMNPLHVGQLTREEITRCENDPNAELTLSDGVVEIIMAEQKKKGRYTPIMRRQDKPDAVLWLIKNCPEMTDPQISRLIGTTKSTIQAIRTKTHWNSNNLRPRDPVLLGLCTQIALNNACLIAKKDTSTHFADTTITDIVTSDTEFANRAVVEKAHSEMIINDEK